MTTVYAYSKLELSLCRGWWGWRTEGGGWWVVASGEA